MKRRLRKKKFKGEFKELGFEVHATLLPGVAPEQLDAVIDRLIDVLLARGLGLDGGSDGETLRALITKLGRGSTTEDDRAATTAHLATEAAHVSHQLSSLRDAWYGWGDLDG